MAKKKTRYTMRSDGIIVFTKTYEGKRKYFYGKSDKEIDQKVAAYEAELLEQARHHSRLFEEIADEWWERKEKELSPNSINSYKIMKERAVDAFGDQYAEDVKPEHIYRFLDGFAKKGYSQKRINTTLSVTKSIFDQALISGEISSNPCVKLPTVKGKPKVKRKPATKDEIKIIEAHKTDSLMARMYYFMLYTGLRRGEAIALQQKNIDRKNKVIHVVQSCAYEFGYKPIIKPPKTEAGIRSVALLDNVAEILPESKDPEAFVFFPDGLPYKTTFERQLRNFRKANDLTCTPHQLRHSFATMGHAAGIDPKDMQHELGHTTLAMTMDTYTADDAEHLKDVRKKLNKYVKKQQKK